LPKIIILFHIDLIHQTINPKALGIIYDLALGRQVDSFSTAPKTRENSDPSMCLRSMESVREPNPKSLKA